MAFTPKVIQKQFYLPAGRAALLYGVIALTCALFGDLTGEQNITLYIYMYVFVFSCEKLKTMFYSIAAYLHAALEYSLYVFLVSGAYIVKRLKLNLTGAARMCFIVAVFGFISASVLYIKCDTPNIAGVNKPYLNR